MQSYFSIAKATAEKLDIDLERKKEEEDFRLGSAEKSRRPSVCRRHKENVRALALRKRRSLETTLY